MRVVRDRSYLKGRQRAARLMFWAGLLCFVASFPIIYLLPTLWFLSYVVLFAGIILFNGGMQQMTKWTRSPRPDEVLDAKLRRFNDRYTMIHFPSITGMRPVPEHVLVYPGGLLVITTREIAANVKVENDRWTRTSGRFLSALTFGGSALGNPTGECEGQQAVLRKFLRDRELLSDDEQDDDLIEGMIVFLNPRTQLEVISSTLTAVTVDEVTNAVRDLGSEALLHTKARDKIIEALSAGDDVEGPISLPTRDVAAKGARSNR